MVYEDALGLAIKNWMDAKNEKHAMVIDYNRKIKSLQAEVERLYKKVEGEKHQVRLPIDVEDD